MISDVDKTGTLEGFTQVVERVAKDPEVNALIILACSDNGFTPAQIDPVLHAIDKPLMGGVFPAVMVGGERLAAGTVVWGVRRPVSISVLQNVSDPSIDMVEALEQALPEEMPENAMAIVFVQ